jgi:hypothetical protein
MLDLLNSPPCDIHYNAACFVTYLSHLKKRNDEPIDSKTIDSYVSHVVYRLVNTGIIDSPDEFRCPSTTRLVAAIKRRDGHIHRPLRETISISLSLPLINECIISATHEFSDPVVVAFVTAALHFGYAFSLRTDDYLIPVAYDLHRIRACNVHAWFLGCAEPFALHQLHPPYQFPPSGSKPLRLSLIVDHDKANVTGDASVRVFGANPIPGQSCFIHWLYEFFLMFPAIDEFTAVFGSIPSTVNTSNKFLYNCFRKTLSITAVRLGLHISQLVPRGARGAATAQIKGSEGLKEDCKKSGGWYSRAHEKYERSDFSMADRCAAVMHNINAVDLNVVRYVHSTPCPPPMP